MDNDPDGLQEIEAVLKEAAITNSVIEFARSSGADAGSGVRYVIYKFDSDTREVHVRRCGSTAHPLAPPSRYRSQYIIWLKSPDGKLISNKLTEKVWSDISLKRANRQDELKGVHESTTNSAKLIGSASAVLGIRSSFPVILTRQLEQLAKTTAFINDSRNEKPLRKALQFLQQYGEWKVYEVIDTFIMACLDWPAWNMHCADLLLEGERLRGALPRLRDSAPSPAGQDTVDRQVQYSARLKLYANSVLRPPDYERDGLAADRVRLFELKQLDYAPFFKAAQSITTGGLRAYLRHTRFFGRLISYDDSSLAAHDIQYLIESGLAIHAREAPVNLILEHLTISELREPQKRFKINVPMRSRQLCIDYYAQDLSPLVESTLRDAVSLKGKLALLPPAGWVWDDILDFHTGFVEMVQELVRWANSEPRSINSGVRITR